MIDNKNLEISKNNIQEFFTGIETDTINIYSDDLESSRILDLINNRLQYKEDKNDILLISNNLEAIYFLFVALKEQFNLYFLKHMEENLRKMRHLPKPKVIIFDPIREHYKYDYIFYEFLQNNKEYKDIPVIIFTNSNVPLAEKLKGLFKGAIDFLDNNVSTDEIIAKINSLVNNQLFIRELLISDIKEKIMETLCFDVSEEKNKNNELEKIKVKCQKYSITNREKDVIALLINGYQYKEICSNLNISINTLKKYIKNIYEKCGVQNNVELTNIIKG